MKGRKPKDIRMKLLQGNPGKGALGKKDSEPFVAGPIDKPDKLDNLASQEWDRLTTTLAPILGPANAGAVLVAATAYSRMRKADAHVRKHGETYVTNGRNGMMIREHPMVGIGDRARIMYHRALAELGATPVGRTRVKRLPSGDAQKPTDLDEMLG